MSSYGLNSQIMEDQLMITLNELLVKIRVPIELETPLDLTPSLLIAILESINGSRLPISSALRESRTFPSKVEAMKVFLGVLENDVIRMDVGLSEVDPRKLAAGDWDEVVFIGELLCWLGKVAKVIPSSPEDPSSTPKPFRRQAERTMSPSTHSTVTNSANSYLSMSRSVPADTDTTVLTISSDHTAPLPELDLFGSGIPLNLPDLRAHSPDLPLPRHLARCIHEIDDSSFVRPHDSLVSEPTASTSYCDCTMEDPLDLSRQKQSPVRSPGRVTPSDDERNAQAFDASKRSTRSQPRPGKTSTSHPRLTSTPQRLSLKLGASPVVTRHTSPSQYRLALLSERARLLEELAVLRASVGKK